MSKPKTNVLLPVLSEPTLQNPVFCDPDLSSSKFFWTLLCILIFPFLSHPDLYSGWSLACILSYLIPSNVTTGPNWRHCWSLSWLLWLVLILADVIAAPVLTDVISGPCLSWRPGWSLSWLTSLLVPVLTDVIAGPFPDWHHGWHMS